jgi:hypothetical protein
MQNPDLKKMMLHVCKERNAWGWESEGGSGGKDSLMGGLIWSNYIICMYENRLITSTKTV